MRPVAKVDRFGTVHRIGFVPDTPCGKTGYTSRKAAAAKAAASRRETGDDIRHYKCEACHCWHIGHRPWWTR